MTPLASSRSAAWCRSFSRTPPRAERERTHVLTLRCDRLPLAATPRHPDGWRSRPDNCSCLTRTSSQAIGLATNDHPDGSVSQRRPDSATKGECDGVALPRVRLTTREEAGKKRGIESGRHSRVDRTGG